MFAFFSPMEGAERGGVFPYLVYVTPNALFPLIALFLWLRLGEFKAYLPLYLAGKVIALIAFYAWAVFSFRPALREAFLGMDAGSIVHGMVLLSGSFILSLGDLLSIFGSWLLFNKVKSEAV
ncbi:sensory box histidine kinase [Leadbettera azotonutricia ZAS-9]|uniref:Sensory box histidine kinase n=2 Tax=Leadbettera azotonutricia TaxID=150829 RepID=F5YDP6_LEAAZ|nr:sensory box histidine kinase [Leadbettera azotonutricia ZAS-9]